MTQFPSDDDRDLINFLKKNRPLIPEEKVDLEEQLIELVQGTPPLNDRPCLDFVNQENFSEQKQPIEPLVWLFPGIFLVGVLLAINSQQPYNYKFTIREFKIPSSTANNSDSDELETFLVNSWQNTMYPERVTEKVIRQNSDLSLSAAK
jgi:hypothetical protein